jgi:hypothetical protein
MPRASGQAGSAHKIELRGLEHATKGKYKKAGEELRKAISPGIRPMYMPILRVLEKPERNESYRKAATHLLKALHQ